MKYDNQLRYVRAVLKEYDGSRPLSVWLKEFFRTNKQMGSRDRKTLSQLVYSWYRLGFHPFTNEEDRLLAAIAISPGHEDLKDYFQVNAVRVDSSLIFPFKEDLSEGICFEEFSSSFLVQPDLFLRVRPGSQTQVEAKLRNANLDFRKCGDNCIALANTSKLDDIVEINREVVVQDKSSQKTGYFFEEAKRLMKTETPAVWDCCAGSGGKSIMARDILGNVNLTVTDKRESIIVNLRNRFADAGIHDYRSYAVDLAASNQHIPSEAYDLIVVDVPCSGSGTWARTPEQLFFFRREKIEFYNELQRSITRSVVPALKKGGLLVYLTCSVFKRENEEVVKELESGELSLLQTRVFAGYNDKADSLFGALFINSIT
jgi:16S rRNA (cytosine967-C5)-methyltransferase